MELTTLKRLRIFIPGLIVLFIIAPLFMNDLNIQNVKTNLELLDLGIITILSAFLGAIYYILNLRQFFFKQPIESINENIKNRLIRECVDDPSISSKVFDLKKNRDLMNIFYDYVDTDNSLTEKAKNVRSNGIILSSIADFMVIGLVAIPIYLFSFIFINDKIHYIWVGLIISILFIICVLIMPSITNKHITLSNEQLDLIAIKHSSDLRTRIKKLLT